MTTEEAQTRVDEIFRLYEEHGGDDYIGEPVSQLEHMVQAAQLAEDEGFPDDVVLAAFFHDIGHLAEHIMPVQHMDGVGVADHESIGADYLRQAGFSESLCKLVQSHVQAKRYLTYKLPEYHQRLSPASKITLSHQGGVMSEAEAQAFEADPLHSLYIKLREWDDRAKEVGRRVPPLAKYKAMAAAHLQTRNFTVS